MTKLLESGRRPYRPKSGVIASVLLHGALITAAVVGTTKVVLPPREKVEEHPILYVAPPPPKPVAIAPAPLPPVPKVRHPEPKPAPKQPQLAVKKPAPAPPPKVPAPPVPRIALTPPPVAPVKAAIPDPSIALADAARRAADAAAEADRRAAADAAADAARRAAADEAAARAKREQTSAGDVSSGPDTKAYSENQVDRTVEVRRAPTLKFPESMRAAGKEGEVVVRYVVGADGKVEPGSIEIISTPAEAFVAAVRSALANARYRPAEANGHAVRQLVQQSFAFRLDR